MPTAGACIAARITGTPRGRRQNGRVTFTAGLLVGAGVTAVAALLVFQARVVAGTSQPRLPRFSTVIAVVALVVAIVALARSGDSGDRSAAPAPGGTTGSSTSSPAPTTPPVTTSSSTVLASVRVPNVIGLAQATAISNLHRAGLKAQVENLPLGNVPAGFVVTQTPVAESNTTSGAVVVIGVSSA